MGYGYVIPNNTNATDVYSSNGTLALNTWHHLALVRNSSTLSLYRNGGLVASTTGVSFNFTQTNVYIYMQEDANNKQLLLLFKVSSYY